MVSKCCHCGGTQGRDRRASGTTVIGKAATRLAAVSALKSLD